jgi:hypothetical protein
MNLMTEAELAAETLKLDVEKVAELRRRQKWPHVRLGRFDVRYTDEQVAAIVAMQTVKPKTTKPATNLAGQTARSARRSA